MTELRQDPTTGNWVIIAPDRGRRPRSDWQQRRLRASSSSGCPLCPGREGDTPAELWRLEGPNGQWRTRVVPNKFPALSADPGAMPPIRPSVFVSAAGTGAHEVVVEARDHNWHPSWAERDAEVRAILETYRARYRELSSEGCAMVAIFRTRGSGAGATLSHPHSQIVASPVLPFLVRHRLDLSRSRLAQSGSSIYAEIQSAELRDGRRLVHISDGYAAFHPFASAVPYETWIMPRRMEASFVNATDSDLDCLARDLRLVLGGLRRALDNSDYNYVLDSAPPGYEREESYCWHLRIVPRLGVMAGLELGTGMSVNTAAPEETAPALREAIQARDAT